MGKVDFKTDDRFSNPNQFKSFALNNNALSYQTQRVNEVRKPAKNYQTDKEQRKLNYLA